MRGANRLGLLLIFAVALGAAWRLDSIARQIEVQSAREEARPVDVIIVMGAAEYAGRPSPVLEARLNHALFLYHQGIAPRILTTGGAGENSKFTEGGVAHAYLSKHGVPSEAIFVEKEGSSTVESITSAYEMMRQRNWQSCVVVSDGYHIYRVKRMLERRGMQAYGSPRPEASTPRTWAYYRQ